MKINQRTDADFSAIKEISDASFSGVEKPPKEALRYNFETGDVFIRHTLDGVYAFAIVTREVGIPHIWSIAVTPNERGLGVGGSLLNEIAGHYREKHESSIQLTVHVNNPAQKLYFDAGFRVVKVIQHFYGAESGIKMRRML